MKININNISDIQFDSNTHYIRSDLKLVSKKEWDSRGWFSRLLDWMARVTINPVKVAPKLQGMISTICYEDGMNIHFQAIKSTFTKLQTGLIKQFKGSNNRNWISLTSTLTNIECALDNRISVNRGRGQDGFYLLED